MKSFIKYLSALFMLALVAACGGSLNKPNIDPQVLSRMDATNSAYLFGSYGYEKKSTSLFGNDIGYLSLLIEPADNPGEKPFYINMVKEDGSFLYSLKQGNYKVKELLLHSMNQNMTVSSMHNFFFTVTNGQIACMGRCNAPANKRCSRQYHDKRFLRNEYLAI